MRSGMLVAGVFYALLATGGFAGALASYGDYAPATRGYGGIVALRSNDARDMPAINVHYFQEGTDHAGEDLASVVDRIRAVRQMNARISNIASSEVLPGHAVQSDADLAMFVKNEAWGHHASCSNRMGPKSDHMAVVDSEFRVFGTRNLRVVDASVFPKSSGYFPMVPILMMNEKASDVILAQASGAHIRRRAGEAACPSASSSVRDRHRHCAPPGQGSRERRRALAASCRRTDSPSERARRWPSLHIRSFQLSHNSLSACWISASPLVRMSADREARMFAIARALPSSFVRALRSPPDRGVG
jgi:GMC oxidoreductase